MVHSEGMVVAGILWWGAKHVQGWSRSTSKRYILISSDKPQQSLILNAMGTLVACKNILLHQQRWRQWGESLSCGVIDNGMG